MMRSLYAAVSGLKTHQTKMDVIGNNVANVNTVAFKSSSVTFSEIMYQTISGASSANAATGTGGVNAKQIGLGVTTGSTKVSVSTAGAAETTGNPFDIKLTDANSTNFFVVNNGTTNLFTRAGSFYVDGSGNLAMSSTGYTLQGWQVDPTTGEIKKDTVSALRIMQEKNLTSAAEATSDAYISGIVDKNDSNINSDNGYTMNLNFYDSLGYSYTAKFAAKVKDADAKTYTVELTDILDSDGKSVMSTYLSNTANSLADVFGVNTTADKKYALDNKTGVYCNTSASAITDSLTPPTSIAAGANYYKYSTYDSSGNAITGYAPVTLDATTGTYSVSSYTKYTSAADAIASTNAVTVAAATGTIKSLYGISDTQVAYLNNAATVYPHAVINSSGEFVVTDKAVNYTLQFDADDGTFSYVGEEGQKAVTLNLKNTLGGNFSDVSIDFSQCKNSNNGGTSTISATAGASSDGTGAGKKLGAMTGVTISNDGKIYGTYDNGNTELLGQIAVAQFANASGLEKTGENCYTTTLNSGEFDGIGVEISADGSKMATGQLEMSNVDLASEFTQMIITQRGYQANSRVITTSDTLLEELINLKR